jgi:hypothetical protein
VQENVFWVSFFLVYLYLLVLLLAIDSDETHYMGSIKLQMYRSPLCRIGTLFPPPQRFGFTCPRRSESYATCLRYTRSAGGVVIHHHVVVYHHFVVYHGSVTNFVFGENSSHGGEIVERYIVETSRFGDSEFAIDLHAAVRIVAGVPHIDTPAIFWWSIMLDFPPAADGAFWRISCSRSRPGQRERRSMPEEELPAT